MPDGEERHGSVGSGTRWEAVAHGPHRTLATLKTLGPGLVAGASDIDPTTVATMAVVGATTIYALSWLAWLLFPMLCVVLVIATRVGAVTGRNLQEAVRDRYGPAPQWVLLLSVVGVNILTLAADIHAGGAALGLLIHRDSNWLLLLFGGATLALLLWGTYDEVERVLKFALLILLAYPVSAALAHPDWRQVLGNTFLPHFSTNSDYVAGAVAMLGTAITGYVYVWQTVQVAEEQPGEGLRKVRQLDAIVGTFFSVAIMWFILIATGATLGVQHRPVDTAEQAAQALAPVVGPYASAVFGVGLLGSALIAVPVLLATTAYAVCAQFDLHRGLSEPVRNAPAFYSVITASTVVAVLISAIGVSTIRLLFLASIVAGVATPIGLAALMLVTTDSRMMGDRAVRGPLRVAGWAVTAIVALFSLAYLVQQVIGGGNGS
ncbi:NRAMP family divalent metal transporter [Pseudonocardia acidicola]|uniref:Divalent metal cation transporter n=1 Tax=Pseudonocardia acidicola TaxID=2724939 RepID=A0ABX1SA00_9PSEU|nr:divalent metal cation transporter [Pseudonocardia acidicola]NMH97069.1 divalent metal cation transporter [Pseudonocardia acidicola]